MGKNKHRNGSSKPSSFTVYLENPLVVAALGFCVGMLGIAAFFYMTAPPKAPTSMPKPSTPRARPTPPSGAPRAKAPDLGSRKSDPLKAAGDAESLRQAGYQKLMAGDREGAAAPLLEALELSDVFDNPPAEYTFYNGLGWSLNDVDPERAIGFYRKAVSITKPPPAQNAHYNLATLLQNKNDLTGAVEVFKDLYASVAPDPKQIHNLAKLELDAGRARDAIETLKSAERQQLTPQLFQQTHYYLAQTYMQLHEWVEASRSWASVIQWGLRALANTQGCSDWKVVEGWKDSEGVYVTPLPPPKGAELAFTDPITKRTYRDDQREYKLIHLEDVLLDGLKLNRIYHPAPVCTFYFGEMTASAMPHMMWGAAEPSEPLHITEDVVVLLDTVGKGHGFYHLQTDIIARILFFLRDVYPTDPKYEEALFLVPPAAVVFLEEIRGTPRAAALGVHVPERQRFLNHAPSYQFDSIYMIDWTPGIPKSGHDAGMSWDAATFDAPLYNLHMPPGALLRLQHQLVRGDGPEYLEEGMEEVGGGEAEEDEDDEMLDLSPGAKKKPKPAAAKQPPASGGVVPRLTNGDTHPTRIVWLSRRDSLERSMVEEDRIIDALRDAFGLDAVDVFGRYDDPGAAQLYDVGRARDAFGEATVIIGPHGAAFCNVLFSPNAAMVLLPICDAVGCPAAQDAYFTYIAAALGVEMVIPKNGPFGESIYRNYTIKKGNSQIDALVKVVQKVVAKRAGGMHHD